LYSIKYGGSVMTASTVPPLSHFAHKVDTIAIIDGIFFYFDWHATPNQDVLLRQLSCRFVFDILLL